MNRRRKLSKRIEKKSGVYKWTNLTDGNSYVGSSVDLGRRFSMYYSEKVLIKELKKKINSHIYRALLKYGHSKFSLEIIEYCEAEEVVTKEQYYIDLLDPEYNICPIAGSSLGRKVSDETRAKLAAAHIGRDYSGLIEHLASLKESNLGRKHLEETKDKIRASALGRKFSDDTRIKLGAMSVEVTDIETNETTFYISASSAAAGIGCDRKTIVSRIRLNSLTPINKRFIVKSPR